MFLIIVSDHDNYIYRSDNYKVRKYKPKDQQYITESK